MNSNEPTLIGHVDSVKGGVVTIRLRDDIPMILMVAGQSYRIGQVGAFLRLPIGYTQLYAVCTLVGAAAAPQKDEEATGHRWLSASLFGESIGGIFERGVSEYPTVDDEVHLVTPNDMRVIYDSTDTDRSVTVGHLAATSGIAGKLDLGRLISRHSAVVGSTGSGKSNLVAVLIAAIAKSDLPTARILVVDPHGEYGSALRDCSTVFRVSPDESLGERPLFVPYWALPFDELCAIGLGAMQQHQETTIRDKVAEYKQAAAKFLNAPPPTGTITADSPTPFNLKELWFELDDFERRTFTDGGKTTPTAVTQQGSALTLTPNRYPPPSPGNKAPFAGQPRHIAKQLDLLRSRILDPRFAFLFNPGSDLTPDQDGKTKGDLHSLVASWVGHTRPVTVLDVSGLPSETLSTIVGTLLRMVYDLLFWALHLPVSGRKQPLLVVLEEAHLFLPEGKDSAAHRTISKIAKEGRKYGVGLCVVTQRPTEIETTVLSQCGTMMSLRLTNTSDRSKVQSAMPDDLGALSGMLPSLRTGEALVVGEAMPIPSRIQFFRAGKRPAGDDPPMPASWKNARPDPAHYETALRNWRHQTDTEKGNKDA